MVRTSEQEGKNWRKQGAKWLCLLLCAMAVAVTVPVAAFAQEAPTLRSANLQQLDAISVGVGRSRVFHTPWPVKRVAVADPAIADVQVIEPNQVLLVGQASGTTDVMIWSEEGHIWQTVVSVEVDIQSLQTRVRELFPGSDITLERDDGVVYARGMVNDADGAQQLRNLLESTGATFVDVTRVPGVQQVQIQVRMAEANRTAIRRLGVNAFQSGDDFFGASLVGPASGGALNPVNMGTLEGVPISDNIPFFFTSDVSNSPLTTLLAGFPNSDLEVFLQALQENQYLKVLAEPNLVALSGEEASFLAGGEFPIPVVQETSTGGGSSITVEYKEFGVKLAFRPEVLGNDVIRLHVAPEVSDLTSVGAVEIQGFRIPAVVTRRSETTLELQSGQTFAMAGLLSSREDGRNSQIPLMGDLPILGPLFRSVQYQKGETELIVLVTASLVEPLNIDAAHEPLPGTLHTTPSDWELFLEGRLEGNVRRLEFSTGTSHEVSMMKKLKGPGPWASHHAPEKQ
jgi:pilus assembly protein CpaC